MKLACETFWGILEEKKVRQLDKVTIINIF